MDFSQLEKRQKNSFGEQKRLIKAVMAGKSVPCAKCRQPLQLQPKQDYVVISCAKGCTELMLTPDA